MSVPSNYLQRVPLRQLFLSVDNVRKATSELDIPELADSIAADGLLQNLAGYAESRGKGKRAKIMFGVVAGGRRFRALMLLVEQKRMKIDFEVPFLVRPREFGIGVSLIENSGRVPLHPADEFVAFRDLVDQGHSIEKVAIRFGVEPIVVHRRLKLANVNPEFLDLYRSGVIELAHMMAFAVTDDHQKQHDAWMSLPERDRSPHALRRLLTETEVPASNRVARFVGVSAYEQAGGFLRTDLFSQEDDESTFLVDPALLNRLAHEKLLAKADELRAEAGAWIEVSPRLDYADLAAYSEVDFIERDPTDQEQQRLDELEAQIDEGRQQLEDMEPEDEEANEAIATRMDALYDEQETLLEGLNVPDPEQNALAGTLLSIADDGELKIHRGLLKADVAARFAREATQSVKAAAPGGPATHTAAMALRLSIHRTLALQATVAANKKVALAALAHQLVLTTFFGTEDPAVRIEMGGARMGALAEDDLLGSKAYAALAARQSELQATLPENRAELFPWLLARPEDEVTALIAFCVSRTLDAVQAQEGPSQADALAEAANLNMSDWWTPTAAGYLGKLKRQAILEIVKTAVSPEQAARLEKLKKSDMASEAERCLSGKQWVPDCFKVVRAA